MTVDRARVARENDWFLAWNEYRDKAIERARKSKDRLPDWYWDHWHILTEARKDAVARLLYAENPEMAMAMLDRHEAPVKMQVVWTRPDDK